MKAFALWAVLGGLSVAFGATALLAEDAPPPPPPVPPAPQAASESALPPAPEAASQPAPQASTKPTPPPPPAPYAPPLLPAPAAPPAPTAGASCEPACSKCASAPRPCACCEPPCWTARAGAIWLTRQRPDDAPLLGTLNGADLLNARDIDFNYRTGVYVDLIRERLAGTCWGAQVTYFGVQWNAATDPVEGFRAGVIPYATPLSFVAANPTEVTNSYHSELHSLEILGRRAITPWLTGLVGYRYLDLNEQGLNINFDNAAFNSIGAGNRLNGIELGLDAMVLNREKFGVETILKAGIYTDRAESSALVNVPDSVLWTSSARTDHTAFVGELDVAAWYNLTEHLSIRGGYMLLWLEGVALASEQVAVSDPFNGTAAVDTTGSPFYHGAFLTLELHR